MTESPEDYELFHYGVKGMKWGVRKNKKLPDISSTPRVAKSSLSNRDRKKIDKIQRKVLIDVHNKTAKYANEHIVPKINEKYKDKKLVDSSGKDTAIGKKYMAEQMDAFDKVYVKNMEQAVFEKSRGRYNVDLEG